MRNEFPILLDFFMFPAAAAVKSCRSLLAYNMQFGYNAEVCISIGLVSIGKRCVGFANRRSFLGLSWFLLAIAWTHTGNDILRDSCDPFLAFFSRLYSASAQYHHLSDYSS